MIDGRQGRGKSGVAYTSHGLGIGDDFERGRKGDAVDLVPNVCDEGLDYGADLVSAYTPAVVWSVWRGTPCDIGHFEIDLCEFWLPVLAPVLIAETPGELEIFIYCA